MGQSFACCSNNNVDNNDIKTNDFNNQLSRLKNSDKIYLIIKIQAAFRGYLTRKKVQRIRDQAGYRYGGGGMFNNHSPDGVQNYDNPDVLVTFQGFLYL
jgi:hypothetical protein